MMATPARIFSTPLRTMARELRRPPTSMSAVAGGGDGGGAAELSPDDLAACSNPAGDLQRVLRVLSAAKLVARHAVDWLEQLQVCSNGLARCLGETCRGGEKELAPTCRMNSLLSELRRPHCTMYRR